MGQRWSFLQMKARIPSEKSFEPLFTFYFEQKVTAVELQR